MKEYTITPNSYLVEESQFDGIIAEFKEHGFNVTKEALLHNYYAWCGDYKSGYRDDENGYHLFTPCGCNPLRFSCTSLEYGCKIWQKTYTC